MSYHQRKFQGMPINEKEFFQQAVIRICKHLDFLAALQESLIYLRSFMSADAFNMNIIDPDLGTLKTLAVVTPSKAERTNIITHLDTHEKIFWKNGAIPLHLSLIPYRPRN